MESSSLKTFFRRPALRVWLIIWIIIYSLIIILGSTVQNNDLLTIIKLGGIILCFVYALRVYPQDHLLHIAMFTTSIADLILAVHNTSEVGIIVFLITQIIHHIRLNDRKISLPLIIFMIIAAICISLSFWLQIIPPIFVISAFYAIAILSNVYLAWRWHQRQAKNWHASSALFGFILFACCDSCTVISYFSLTGALPALFYALANFFAWFFYYPSQILVSNSSKCAIMSLKEGKC